MKKLALIFSLVATSAFAQQPVAPTAQEQIEKTIGSLFVANTNLQSQLQAAQSTISNLQSKIKELEEKDNKK